MPQIVNEASGVAISSALSATLVDLTSTGDTTLYIVPAGKNLVVTSVILFNPSSSLTAFSWSIGYNVTHDDVIGGQLTSGLTLGDYAKFQPTSPAIIGIPDELLKIAVGSTHSGVTVTVQVLGYLV